MSVCNSRVSLLSFAPITLQDVARESFGQLGRSSQLHAIAKDPAVLKVLRVVNLLRVVNSLRVVNRYRDDPFLGFTGISPLKEVFMAWQFTIFCVTVVFLGRLGPGYSQHMYTKTQKSMEFSACVH